MSQPQKSQPQKTTPRSLWALCFISLFICTSLIGLVLWTGQEVASVEAEIRVKNQSLNYEQERLRILRAEWSQLNSPERLEKLMRKKREWEGKTNSTANTNPYAKHLNLDTTKVKGETHD